MTQATMQVAIEATKAAIMAVREMEIPVNTIKPGPAMLKKVIHCHRSLFSSENLQISA